MRISCVLGPFLPVPPLLGGAVERIFLSLCEQFAARGHDVTLISRRYGDLAHDERVRGVRHLRVPSSDAPASMALYRALDVIYALRVCAALPRSDITITNSVSLPLLLPRRKAGAIYVSVGRFPKGQMHLYGRAARLQAVSVAVADAICTQAPAMAPRVRAIGNPLAPEFIGAIAPRQPRARKLLYVGRIAREKGLHLLIEAFARVAAEFADWSLDIVGPWRAETGGDGEQYIRELRALAAPLGARVVFAGPDFDTASLITRMRGAEVFVYPSVAEMGESFGLAPLEAMACGCATIVSGLSCFEDFLDHEVNGLRFDHRADPVTALADACAAMMRDSAMRRGLGEAAMRTAGRFAPEVIADRMLDDFASLLGKRAAAKPALVLTERVDAIGPLPSATHAGRH